MILPDPSVGNPHPEELATAEKEQGFVDEVDKLKERLDGQSQLNLVLARSIHMVSRQLTQAEENLHAAASLSFYHHPQLWTPVLPCLLKSYPCSTPPPRYPPLEVPAPAEDILTSPYTQRWETSGTGYAICVVGITGQDLGRRPWYQTRPRHGSNTADELEADAMDTSKAEELRHALEAVTDLSRPREGGEAHSVEDNISNMKQ